MRLWLTALLLSCSMLGISHASENNSEIRLLDRSISGKSSGLIAGAVKTRRANKISITKAKPEDYITQDIPMVLSKKDVKSYKKMFRLQRQLQRSQVANMVPKLEDRVLMGHLIATRIMHPRTKAPYTDLRSWLAKYGDHAQSTDIYKMANKRRPSGSKLRHKKPDVLKASIARYSDPDELRVSSKPRNTKKRRAMIRRLKHYRLNQYYSKADSILAKSSTRRLIGESTWNSAYTKLIRSTASNGYHELAAKFAKSFVSKSEQNQPEALWLAGFSLYTLGDIDGAVSHFRRLAYSVPKNSKYFSKAAWWAAKGYSELGRESMTRVFLNLSMQDPYSFYGQLSTERLGRSKAADWREPQVDSKHRKILFSDPVIRRVIALVQIGEHGLAQQELKQTHKRLPYDMDESLLAFSIQLNMPNSALTLARNLQEQGKTYLSGLYPRSEVWEPRGGFTVDRAVLDAVMRQESAFNPYVVSSAGARGLMQLMPATAKFIRRKGNKPVYSRASLNTPSINMGLGQEYIVYLDKKLDGNLVHIIAGYNAGPGNVNKWMRKNLGGGDPIMFIENIPFSETKKYVKRVLSNIWMYRSRYGEKSPTLTAMANNRWPVQMATYGSPRKQAKAKQRTVKK